MTFRFPEGVATALTLKEAAFLHHHAHGKDNVLELGAQYGASTIVLARAARQVVSVDWHQGDAHAGLKPTLGAYLGNIRDHRVVSNIVTILARFEDALPLLAPDSFDLIFLDGFHTHDAVGRDLQMALPLVKRPGKVLFHDYGRFAGVTDRARELAAREMSRVEVAESMAAVYVNRVR